MILSSMLPWLALGPFISTAGASLQQDLKEIQGRILRGELGQAEGELRELLAADSNPRVQYLLGFVMLQTGRFAEAEELLSQAVEARPENHPWMHALGKALVEQGKKRAAIEILDRAIALEPRPRYYFSKAVCALNAGDLATAEEALQHVLEEQPDHPQALVKMGKVLLDRGDYEASLPLLRRSLELNPAPTEAHYLLGLAELRTGDLTAAIREFRQVLRNESAHLGALYNLNRALQRAGQIEEARQVQQRFQEASALEEKRPR